MSVFERIAMMIGCLGRSRDTRGRSASGSVYRMFQRLSAEDRLTIIQKMLELSEKE